MYIGLKSSDEISYCIQVLIDNILVKELHPKFT